MSSGLPACLHRPVSCLQTVLCISNGTQVSVDNDDNFSAVLKYDIQVKIVMFVNIVF